MKQETNLMQARLANQHQVIMPSWLPKVPSWLRKNALCLSQSAFSNFAPYVIIAFTKFTRAYSFSKPRSKSRDYQFELINLWQVLYPSFLFLLYKALCRKTSTLCAIQALLRAKKDVGAICWSYEENQIPKVLYCCLCWIVFFGYNCPFILEFKNGWKLYRYGSFTSFNISISVKFIDINCHRISINTFCASFPSAEISN